MPIALGIDTGGTYTDAVLVDMASEDVLAGNKALTTRHDLSLGVARAIEAVLHSTGKLQDGRKVSPADVDLVGLSTTLATNAIVEGQGRPVCLILIGYDEAFIQRQGVEGELVTGDVVYVQGGHDADGNEVAPLDENAVREAVLARRDSVEAFAVSGYFGVRNPEHELRARALIQELTAAADEGDWPFPVTCGHELTTRLNAVRRATTAALNARLIPLLRDLIVTVRRTLDGMGIHAPLMIVKGDGSLVQAEWAMRRPIETILSGPAASLVGAWHLAGREDVWVVDVGGTTTDIGALRGGMPRLNPEGAQVGGWRTMIEAADIHTAGLGGDSHVRLNGSRVPGAHGLTVGPRRVVPLCLLASEYPQVVDELQRQVQNGGHRRLIGQFVLAQRRTAEGLAEQDRDLLSYLEDGPRSLAWLAEHARYGMLIVRQVEELVARQVVLLASFTPTDALHVLGRFAPWDARAARLGAELLAAQAHVPVDEFCRWVVAAVSNRVTTELVSKVLNDEVSFPRWECEPSAHALLSRAMGSVAATDLGCQLSLRQPVVAVGAPVEAYLPRTAEQLHTSLIIPPYAEVANAVGAVAGGVVQRQRVLIRVIDAGLTFRVHLRDGVHDFAELEEAVAYARHVVPGQVTEMARQAGARQVEVQVERDDLVMPAIDGEGQEVYVETEMTFTAVGRPGLAVVGT